MVGSGKAAKKASKVKVPKIDKVKRRRRRRRSRKEGKLCHLFPHGVASDAPRHRHRLEGHVDHELHRVHHDEFESIGAL